MGTWNVRSASWWFVCLGLFFAPAVPALAANRAEAVGNSLPSDMMCGDSVSGYVRMKNKGQTWKRLADGGAGQRLTTADSCPMLACLGQRRSV